jgi:hypothetical protein
MNAAWLQRFRGEATLPDIVPIHAQLVIRESTRCPYSRRTLSNRIRRFTKQMK